MSTKPDVDTGWTKPSSIRCFDDWFRREDFGDRNQLERCWANAQNVAARDRRDTSPSDFEQLLRLRKAAEAAIIALDMATFGELDATGERAKRLLREALAHTGEQS